jgi:Fic family protein
MARCLQTLLLARDGILSPPFCSVEEYLGRYTRDYYEVLATVGGGGWNPDRDTRPWIQFILNAHYQQATTLLRRSREMARLWEIIETEAMNRGLMGRVVPPLVNAALGYKTRNQTYRMATDVSDNQASHDLTTLVREGLLIAQGAKRGRFYVASDKLLAMRELAREPKKHEDPFSLLSQARLWPST